MGKKITKWKIIDLFERYIWHVEESVRFVKMGSGKQHYGVFNILEPLLKKHKKDLYDKIKEEMSKPENN